MTGFRQSDVVASADGNPRKARGTVKKVMHLTAQDWADRGHCWMFDWAPDCRNGGQQCLRARPSGPGEWVIVYWDGRTGPYAERAENLVRIGPA